LVSPGDVGLDDAGEANDADKTFKLDRSRSKGGGFEKLRMPSKGRPLG